MGLHLVGENISPKAAHQRMRAGDLIQLVRGVYVDDDSNIETTISSHAVRIANYLYPNAYLSSASAVLLAPTPDGRLFISGRRNQRTRLRALEIIQNQAPPMPSTAVAIVGDDLGEQRIGVSSPRQRFLEAFRLRSEHANAITPEMRHQLALRLVEEFGSPQAAADATWALARENAWYREGEGAERYLLARSAPAKAPTNKAALDLIVAWHGDQVGRLTHDGFEWRWQPKRGSSPTLIREITPGKLPGLIESLLPEGWLAKVLHDRDERETLRHGRRYMSNITIVEKRAELAIYPADVLTSPLAHHTEDGRFTGRYEGPASDDINESFELNLARVFAAHATPRLSGVQIKIPMTLTAEGRLSPATDAPFTHILKPAGTSGYETLPIVEWICLQLGRAAGFEVPDTALVQMPNELPPALLVERFDIRRNPSDLRRLMLEDFCSVLDVPASAKYDSTIERVAKALRPISTEPGADLELLFRRAVFAWLVADGDMHLKNLAVLKTAQPDSNAFTAVRLAPLYDSVTTRVFPGLAEDRMALKLNGKDARLAKKDFMAAAETIGLPAQIAMASLEEASSAVIKAVKKLTIPSFANSSQKARSVAENIATIVIERATPFVE